MLTVAFDKQLPEFDLQIEFNVANNILVLFGPSGCGKTTILRCIAGLTKPDSGRIALDQKALYDSSADLFTSPKDREVGYVFQNYALFPHMDIAKNILYSVNTINEQVQQEYTKLLCLLKIEKLVKRFPAELSGGEQQRVALARALMAGPKILLLDEPLSALDNNIRSELQDELLKMQQIWRIPFVLVTHDGQEAEKLGEQIVFLDKGRRVQ